MSDNAKSRPSFSPADRWKIGFDVVLRTALVLAVLVMLSYLGTKFYHRYYLSQQNRVQLASRTLTVLHALTNQVQVTLYYDTKADFRHDGPPNYYADIVALLNEYSAANKNISIRTVDYKRDPGAAEKVKEQFHLPGSSESPNAPPAKDLIIFQSGDRWMIVPGEAVVQTQLKQIAPENPKQKELEFRRKPVDFNGEILFTSKLLALASPKPLKAYYLQGDGEATLTDSSSYGFLEFGREFAQNFIGIQYLELPGDNPIPMDCSLLIITPPTTPLSEAALQKIDKYLAEGGRLLVLFNFLSIQQPTGLEPILQRWGVNVMPDFVKDRDSANDSVIVGKFSTHPVVSSLAQLRLQMARPRCIAKINWQSPPANAPQVDELAFSGDNCILSSDPTAPPRSYPLMAAVEQKPVAGVVNPRGNTRIIVVGDSLFVGNSVIGAGGNRDFVGFAANWLEDREQLLGGIAPRPVTEFQLLLTQAQQRQLRWLLLGALPGSVLLLGWLVWLVRRQ